MAFGRLRGPWVQELKTSAMSEAGGRSPDRALGVTPRRPSATVWQLRMARPGPGLVRVSGSYGEEKKKKTNLSKLDKFVKICQF